MNAPATGAADRVELGSAKYELGRKLSEIVTFSKTWEEVAERAARLFVTPPVGAVGGDQTLWLVFAPSGVPQPHTCRLTHDDAMQACFGRYESGRYPGEWWQHNLDEGWTCREVALTPPSSGAGAAGLEEVVADLAAIELQVRITCENERNESAAKRADPVGTMVELSLSHVLDRVQSIRATIARQADDLERLRGDGWQPIETAPPLPVLLFIPSARSGRQISTGHRIGDHNGVWVIGGAFSFDVGEPTHWRPLPEPPARAQIARPSADQREGADEGGGRP